MRARAIIVGLAVLLAPAAAGAHALAPALLVLREVGSGLVEVTWKMPSLRVLGADLQPVLPSGCAPTGAPTVAEDDLSLTSQWTINCGAKTVVKSYTMELAE